jgi:hypothetical protein
MEQIEQLKAMRDAARARLEATPDHRLMTSLTALITDLEAAFGGEAFAGSTPSADAAPAEQRQSASEPAPSAEPQAAPEPAAAASSNAQANGEETVVVVETVEEFDPGQISFDEIELDITPEDIEAEDIETAIAAEVLSMNGDAVAGSLSETAEEAVNRALDELSIDLADSLGAAPAPSGRKR